MPSLTGFRRYLAFLVRLGRDALWEERSHLAFVLISGFIGAVGPPAALGQLTWYAKVLERGDEIKMLGYTIQPRESQALLLTLAAIILITLLISTTMTFLAQRASLNLAVEFERKSIERVLIRFLTGIRSFSPYGNEVCDELELRKLICSDARISGRMVRVLLGAVVPSFSMIMYAAILLSIAPVLTVLIFVITGISSTFLSRVARRGARASILLERYNKDAIDEKTQLLRRGSTENIFSSSSKESIRASVRSGMIEESLQEFRARLLSLDYSVLVSSFAAAIAFSLILLYLGGGALAGTSGWGVLAVYFVTLRMFLRDVLQLSRRATSIGRFYPVMRRYYAYMDGSALQAECEPVSTLILEHPAIGEDRPFQYRLSKGHCLLAASPVSLNRYTISYIVDGLVSGGRKIADGILADLNFLASADNNPENVPAHATRALRESEVTQSILREMNSPLGQEMRDITDPDMDRGILWSDLSDDARKTFTLLLLATSDASWVFVDLSLYSDAMRAIADCRSASRLFDSKCLVLVQGSLEVRDLIAPIDCMAVIGDGEVLAVGSGPDTVCTASIQSSFEELRTRLSSKRTVSAGAGDEEDI